MAQQHKECPKCKAKQGWFERRINYYEQYYDANGEASHASDGVCRGGKRKYCYECGTDITHCVTS